MRAIDGSLSDLRGGKLYVIAIIKEAVALKPLSSANALMCDKNGAATVENACPKKLGHAEDSLRLGWPPRTGRAQMSAIRLSQGSDEHPCAAGAS